MKRLILFLLALAFAPFAIAGDIFDGSFILNEEQAEFALSSQNMTCNQAVEAADRYLGPGNEMGSAAHEVICDHFEKLFMGCFSHYLSRGARPEQAGLYCTMVTVGYNEAKVVFDRATRFTRDRREITQLHSGRFFYELFKYSDGHAVQLMFHQRVQEQGGLFDWENYPHSDLSLLSLWGPRRDAREMQFRVKGMLEGYNRFRKFMTERQGMRMPPMAFQQMFTPDGRPTRTPFNF